MFDLYSVEEKKIFKEIKHIHHMNNITMPYHKNPPLTVLLIITLILVYHNNIKMWLPALCLSRKAIL